MPTAEDRDDGLVMAKQPDKGKQKDEGELQ